MKPFKKLVAVITASLLLVSTLPPVLAFDMSDISGTFTVENYKITDVAPEARHISFRATDKSGLQNVNAIEFNPKNEYTPLRAGKSAGFVYSTQTVNTIANNMSSVDGGDVAVAAVNGDFFTFGVGVPHGVFIDEGIILSTPPQYYAAFGLTYDNEPFIVRHGTILDKIFRINGVLCDVTGINNAHAKGVPSLMLYTSDYARGTKTGATTYELRCRVNYGEVRHGDTINFTVEEVFDAVGNTELGDGYIVLSAQGERIDDLKKLSVGDTLEMSFRFNEFWSNVKFAVGGIELLLKDGEIYSRADKSNQPRTAVGIREDGSVVMATFDGRQKDALGMSYEAAAEALLALGCRDALNLDGGGSTTFVLRSPGAMKTSIVNSISGTSARQVANALVLMNTAPTLSPDKLALSPAERFVLIGGEYDFDVIGAYDRNFKPSSVPANIYWSTDSFSSEISDDGTFKASEWGTYRVMASANGAVGESLITVFDEVSELTSSISEISASPLESIDIPVTAFVDGKAIEASPELFNWTYSEGLGTFSEPGKFIFAEDFKSGEITVSFGNVFLSIPVTRKEEETEEPVIPANPPVILSGFEGDKVSFIPVGISTKTKPNSKIETDTKFVYDDLCSLKVYYNFLNTTGSVGSYYMISPESPDNSEFKFTNIPNKLGMFVYGDGSGIELRSILEDSTGKQYSVSYGKIEHTEWKYMEATLPEGLSNEIYVKVPVHLVSNPEKLTHGCLYFDRLRAVYDEVNEDLTAPTITKAWPSENLLIYGRTPSIGVILADETATSEDAGIVPESIEFWVNGYNCTDHSFDVKTGKISYTIKVPLKNGFHKIYVRARDKAGNLISREWKFEVR